MKEITEFKVGDVVRVHLNESDSINKVGDVGVITEVDDSYLPYRVTVEGSWNRANWHREYELKLLM